MAEGPIEIRIMTKGFQRMAELMVHFARVTQRVGERIATMREHHFDRRVARREARRTGQRFIVQQRRGRNVYRFVQRSEGSR